MTDPIGAVSSVVAHQIGTLIQREFTPLALETGRTGTHKAVVLLDTEAAIGTSVFLTEGHDLVAVFPAKG